MKAGCGEIFVLTTRAVLRAACGGTDRLQHIACWRTQWWLWQWLLTRRLAATAGCQLWSCDLAQEQ